ncbi:MAG: universal stress protein [Pirellulaceae bacterium]|nr:universal stress protein [Pirellulaceae bacterium]
MRSLQTLLMATDFGSASHSLTLVTARLARVFGSRVVPLHVVDVHSDSILVDYYRRQIGQRLMDPLVETLKEENVELAHPIVLTGSVVDQILRKADELEADMIILGVGEPDDYGTVSAGPNAEAVMQRAHQPVLVIHPSTPLFLQRILCPFDGSETALRGLKNAIRLAQAFQAELRVVTVVPQVNWVTAAAEVGSFSNVHEQYSQQWEESFHTALGKTDFGGVNWSPEVRSGSASQELLAAASEMQADLIVMGATGKSGVTRMLLGSTTRRVLRKLPCSLLVVHDEDALQEELQADDVKVNQLAYAAATALLAEQSYEAALRKFDRVLARNPFHMAALEGKAKACEALGQYERAARCHRRAEVLRHES